MTVLVAMLLGTLAGSTLVMIPGMALAVALSVLLALGLPIGGLASAVFISSAVGGALYSKHLSFVFNPNVGGGNLASMDPALRMAMAGRARSALALMIKATDHAWIVVGFFGILVAVAAGLGTNAVRSLDALLGGLGVPLILFWIGSTCRRSKRPLRTLCGFLLTGLLGYVVLHAPALTGNAQQLAPLLGGLFGLPILIQALRASRVTFDALDEPELSFQRHLPWLGAGVGCLTGFFAGLGSGSLVALLQSQTQSDEDYVVLGTAAESSNDLLAIVLVLAAGLGRSGEAVLLGRVAQSVDPLTVGLVVSGLLFGAQQGRKVVLQQAGAYSDLIAKVPRAYTALLILVLTLVPVQLAGGGTWTGALAAWSALLAGLFASSWVRANHLPNQVLFGALAVPLVLQAAGLVPVLNALLFQGV